MVKQTKRIDGFIITIPTQLIEKLKQLKAQNKRSKYIFSCRNSYYSGDTLCRYCKKLSIKYGLKEFRPHDARRTARTLLADIGNTGEVIDAALAHIPKGIDKAYLQTNLSIQRAKLLQDWADLIEKLSAST